MTVACVALILKPWGQASLNTPLVQTYLFEAVGESGQRYSINSNFLVPYDAIFAQRRFHCLSSNLPIVSTFGTTKKQIVADAIKAAGADSERIMRIANEGPTSIAAKGLNEIHDWQSVEQFDQFVQRFVKAKLSAGRSRIAERIGPFRHIVQSPRSDRRPPYDWQEKIEAIDIFEVQEYYDSLAIKTLRDELCHRVKIDNDQAKKQTGLTNRQP